MNVPDLVASYYTLSGHRPFDGPFTASPRDLRSRIEAAARAGYKGIGVDCLDLEASVALYGHAEIKAMLAANALDYFEIEGVGDWYGDSPGGDPTRALVLAACAGIGVSQIKVTGNIFGRSVPAARMRSAFAALCKEAEPFGARIVLEMVVISDIADLATAAEVIGETPNRNGGLLLDVWHVVRGGIPFQEVAALPQGLIRWVELDDGAAQPVGSIISEQLDDRRLPGEGSYDLAGFLSATRAAGYSGPCGIEILSNEIRAMTLDEAARRSFEQAARQFAAL